LSSLKLLFSDSFFNYTQTWYYHDPPPPPPVPDLVLAEVEEREEDILIVLKLDVFVRFDLMKKTGA